MSTTYTYTAADELDRRATNRKNVALGLAKDPYPAHADQKFLHMTGAELRALAGVKKPAKAKATKPVQVEKIDRRKVSKLGLTPDQQKRQQEIYQATGGGKAYHDACLAENIPTTKNGLAPAK